MIYSGVCKRKDELYVNVQKLPCKWRLPGRLEDGSAKTHHFPSTPKEHYRRIYFQALDSAMSCMKDRFDQPDFRKVCSFYTGDIDKYRLEPQLPFLLPIAIAFKFDLKNFTVYYLITCSKDLTIQEKLQCRS